MQLIKGVMKLQQAYTKRDWDLVASAYEMIAGEPIEVEEVEEVEEVKPEVKPQVVKAKYVKPKPTPAKKASRPKIESLEPIKRTMGGSIKFQRNQFDAILGLIDDENTKRRDTELDKKLGKKFKRAKPRQEFEMKVIKCKGCKKDCEVNPELIRDNEYTCDDCIIKKGSNAN